MSYYMGDYYRGDPGFLSFLGNIGKAAVGLIPGVGPILSKGLSAGTALATRAPRVIDAGSVAAAGASTASGVSLARRVGGTLLKHPVLTGIGAAGAGAVIGAGGPGRLLKRGERALGLGGRRRRRMNVCNQRALRRALRRAHGFERIAMRTIRIVNPKKRGHFAGFKKRRTRR